MKSYIFTHGDPSVGIHGQSAEVHLVEWEFLDIHERNAVRQELSKCFQQIYMEKPVVLFQDEILDETVDG